MTTPRSKTYTRRQAVTAIGIGVGGIVLGAGGGVLIGRDPQQTPSASPSGAATPAPQPGYYRYKVGGFTVTSVLDGTFELDASTLLSGISESELSNDLREQFRSDPIISVVNCFLVDTGKRLVLIDAGSGTALGPGAGKLISHLTEAGYDPADIDEIVFTHLHSDHVGGTYINGEVMFPKASIKLRTTAAESAYWLNSARESTAPAASKTFFEVAMKNLQPYSSAGRLGTFGDGAVITPGITAVPLPGHTPGHTGYLVEDSGEKLLIWGDIVHVAEVQFAMPSVTISFDSAPSTAAQSREMIYAAAASERLTVAGSHIPFPGIGHVATSGDAYRFIPLAYGD